MARFHFRKNLNYDLALLSEVSALNPYSLPKGKAKSVWGEVAENLKKSKFNLPVDSRRCRERVTKLLMEFRSQEALSVKASGVEEAEMDQIKHLLTSISSMEEIGPVLTQKIINKNKRSQAELTRERALSRLKESVEVEGNESTDSDEVDPNNKVGTNVLIPKNTLFVELTEDEPSKLKMADGPPIVSPGSNVLKDSDKASGVPSTQSVMEGEDEEEPLSTKFKRGNQTGNLIHYLKNKTKDEIGVKKEELKVRAAEAENRKLELQLAKQRQDVELEEKKKFTDLLLQLVNKNTK